jgi:hypothetical protein
MCFTKTNTPYKTFLILDVLIIAAFLPLGTVTVTVIVTEVRTSRPISARPPTGRAMATSSLATTATASPGSTFATVTTIVSTIPTNRRSVSVVS